MSKSENNFFQGNSSIKHINVPSISHADCNEKATLHSTLLSPIKSINFTDLYVETPRNEELSLYEKRNENKINEIEFLLPKPEILKFDGTIQSVALLQENIVLSEDPYSFTKIHKIPEKEVKCKEDKLLTPTLNPVQSIEDEEIDVNQQKTKKFRPDIIVNETPVIIGFDRQRVVDAIAMYENVIILSPEIPDFILPNVIWRQVRTYPEAEASLIPFG